MTRPMSQASLVAAGRARHRPAARRCARRTVCDSPSHARTSSRDSSSAGISHAGVGDAPPGPSRPAAASSSSPASARHGARHDRTRRATADGRHQVGSALRRTPHAPGRAARRRSRRGRRTAAPAGTSRPRQDGGLGVDGVLEQPVLVGLLDQRLGVAHEPRHQPYDGLGDRQRGDLAPVEHVVAEARSRATSAPGRRPRRAPAGRCPRSGRTRRRAASRPASSRASAWVNGLPGRGGEDDGRRRRRSSSSASKASPQGSGFITMPAPPPYGRVVDGAVPVVGPARAGRARARRSARGSTALPGERELERGEVVGEDRDVVDAHRAVPTRPRAAA